jgi:CHASE1-domain containing sensor protein
MEERTTTLRRRIAALLGSDAAAPPGELHDVLMTGYALALELDAERLRLEREITASAPRVRDGAVAVRVEEDGARLAAVTALLGALRADIEALRAHP